MSIRIRVVNGKTVALCAAKTESKMNDLYLDEVVHHALYRKFQADFIREGLIRQHGWSALMRRKCGIILNGPNS